MLIFKRLSLVMCVFLVAGLSFGQTAPVSAGKIYAVPAAGPGYVFVSVNEIEEYYDGQVSVNEIAEPVCLFGEDNLLLEDMVIGPDGFLYVAANYVIEGGPLVFRMDLFNGSSDASNTDAIVGGCGSSLGDVEIIYEDNGDGPSEPVAPWFNFDGTLFVSSRGGSVWAFEGIVDSGPTVIPTQVFAPGGNAWEGLTQGAQGHLIMADSGGGAVWGYPMNVYGDLIGPLQELIPDLNFPTGVARASDGTVFVTDFEPYENGSILLNSDAIIDQAGHGVLYMYPADGTDPVECWDFGAQMANFLEAESEDVMWLTTTSGLWKVEYDKQGPSCVVTNGLPTEPAGASEAVADFDFEIRGIALPPTAREGSEVGGYDGLMFSQGDNAFHVTNAGDDCGASLMVYEALQADIDAIIGDQLDITLTRFLGDNGRYQVFDINGDEESTCNPFVDYTISSFFDADAGTAAIVHCSDEGSAGAGPWWDWDGSWSCDVIPVSNFSLIGDIPEDGRRTGTGAGFSLLMAAEWPRAEDGAPGSGDFCGLLPPVKKNIGPDEFNLLTDDPDDVRFPKFKTGRTLPLKFRAVDLSHPRASCKKGPFLYDLTVALSATKIFEHDGTGWQQTSHPVKPVPKGKGYVDEFGRAIFGESGNKYHFNWRLDEDELEGPGIYELWIMVDPVDVGGSMVVPFTAVRYIEIVE